jgi:hypothetical protein
MMTTIRLTAAFLILFISSLGYSQLTSNPDIQNRLDAFIDLTNQHKYSEAFDLMYPKMFTRVGKQELVDMMTAMNNDGLAVSIENRRITSFSAPVEEGNEKFVRIEYTADMIVGLTKGGLYDSPKASQAMLQQFQNTYGETNVKWNADEKKYAIRAHKAMMAIQQDGGEWYLIEINPDQMELMQSLFSESVINALVKVE